jgi:pSer/pThr/pTyr-binding forkhead associated (FHA) protein
VHFPCVIRDRNKKIEIFKLQRPLDGHYIVLEVLGMPNGKTFQVIRLTDRQSLKVGRGHDSDVRVADISVSRCHSLLRFDSVNNQVILSDYHSKFGTLLLIK